MRPDVLTAAMPTTLEHFCFEASVAMVRCAGSPSAFCCSAFR